jgi:putative membrane protein
VFLAAGVLGDLALFNGDAVAPLFVGLFGVPALVLALADPPGRVPEPLGELDRGCEVEVTRAVPWTSVIRGSLAGTVVGWFPGVSPAQATILAVPTRDPSTVGAGQSDDTDGARRFIAGVSAVNTSNAVFNLVALATLLRVRSGATASVGELMAWSEPAWGAGAFPSLPVALLLAAAAIGGLVAVPFTLRAGRVVERLLPVLTDQRFLFGLVLLLVAVCVGWGGWHAGLVILAASALGLIPPLLGLMRVHLMGAVIFSLVLSLLF